MSDGVGINLRRIVALSVAAVLVAGGVWKIIVDATSGPRGDAAEWTPDSGVIHSVVQSSPRGGHVSAASIVPINSPPREHRPSTPASRGAAASDAAAMRVEAGIAEARAASMPVLPLEGAAPNARSPLAIRLVHAEPVEPGSGTWRIAMAVTNISDGPLGMTAFTLSASGLPLGESAQFVVRSLPRGRGDMVVSLVENVPAGFDAARLEARIVRQNERVESRAE